LSVQNETPALAKAWLLGQMNLMGSFWAALWNPVSLRLSQRPAQ